LWTFQRTFHVNYPEERPTSLLSRREATNSNKNEKSIVAGDYPYEKGYPGPPGWGLGVRLTTSPCIKVENLRDAMERIDKQKAIWL
jgi:hypothetical protein